jgi:DNA-binding XRE family transcriptional regulator
MAAKVGCIRCTYAAIENGTRAGRDFFWESLQKAFNIPDEDMWELKKKDKK